MMTLHRQAIATIAAVCAVVFLAAAVVVNTPSRLTLMQQAGHVSRPRAGPGPPYPPPGPSWDGVPARKAPQQQLVTGFSQPGYNPKDPKGLWGHGVPPEYVDDDYKLVKSLATVEQDLNSDEVLMNQVNAMVGKAPMQLKVANGQQLAVGGVDIEGGQGESDSIFGSHDDHSTYGVAGSGWQGMGNGEMPGELWNPAVRPSPFKVMPGQQLAVGGVDIEGGQGESDSIFGSHDDHSTYGVSGSGWQGMGNGEMPGELWNPAISNRQQGIRQQQLAGPVPYPQPGAEWYETEWGKHSHTGNQ